MASNDTRSSELSVDALEASGHPTAATTDGGKSRRLSWKVKSSFWSRAALGAMLTVPCLVAATGCAEEEPPAPPPQERALGRGFFALMCDRVGGLAIREDFTGESYARICRPNADGAYDDKINADLLPPITEPGVKGDGTVVSIQELEENRKRRLARVEALARHREELINAFEAIIPDKDIPLRGTSNRGIVTACTGDAGSGKLRQELLYMLSRQLDMLGKSDDLEVLVDTMGGFMQSVQKAEDARLATSRVMNRDGFQPAERSVGFLQYFLANPRLPELSDAFTHYVVPADQQAQARRGNAGAGAEALQDVLRAAGYELQTLDMGARLAPLVVGDDGTPDKNQSLSRPRTGPELIRYLLTQEHDDFQQKGKPTLVLTRDERGMPFVSKINGAFPRPFVDKDNDGLADIDKLGRFVALGQETVNPEAPSPFVAPQLRFKGTRDKLGRAVEGAAPIYDYQDINRTYLANLVADLRAVLEGLKKTGKPEIFLEQAGVLGALAGPKSPQPNESVTFKAPSSTGKGTTVTFKYKGHNVAESPLVDILHLGGHILSAPEVLDMVVLSERLIREKPEVAARFFAAVIKLLEIPPSDDFPVDDFLNMARIVEKGEQKIGIIEPLVKFQGTDFSKTMGEWFTSIVNQVAPSTKSYFNKEFIGAMNATVKAIDAMQVAHCKVFDPKTAKCTSYEMRDGAKVTAELVRLFLDDSRMPNLKDRRGHDYVIRADGKKQSPISLAMLAVDTGRRAVKAFDEAAKNNPDIAGLGDKLKISTKVTMEIFAGVEGEGESARFKNKAVPRILPILLDAVHAQVVANCAQAPAGQCKWASKDLPDMAARIIGGPLFPAVGEFQRLMVKDKILRQEVIQLVEYVLQDSEDHRALAAIADTLQVTKDELNLGPFVGLVSRIVADTDGKGGFGPTVIPALLRNAKQMMDLGRDDNGVEDCSRQMDPNRAVGHVIRNLFLPMGDGQRAPLQLISSALGDVNRFDPSNGGPIDANDVLSVSKEVEFGFLDRGSGLKRIVLMGKKLLGGASEN